MKDEKVEKQNSFFQKSFVTGLFIVIPVLVTIWVGWWTLSLLTSWAVNIIPSFYPGDISAGKEMFIRFAALILILLAVWLIGVFGRVTFGKRIIELMQKLLLKLPILRIVYSTCEQIGETVKNQRGGLFKQAVIFEYPMRGTYAIGFITNSHEERSEVTDKIGQEIYSVFMPTTPNPTSGFLIMVPKKDCIILDMAVGDAMKLIVSGGVFLPGPQNNGEKK